MTRLRPVTAKTWQKMFLLCLGIAIGAAFCMKLMEGDFIYNKEKFSILGMELWYPKEKLSALLTGLTTVPDVLNILFYHLTFDFAFMAGIYPGITALCMIGREKTASVRIRRVLFVLASIQLIAWAGDIVENSFLFHWASPGLVITDTDFLVYHIAVYVKWIFALAGFLFALPFAIRKRKPGF